MQAKSCVRGSMVALFLLAMMAFCRADDVQTLFDNGNIAGVYNGPTVPTTFTLASEHTITFIMTYHWNAGQGKTAGTIALRHSDGTLYGPYVAEGSNNVFDPPSGTSGKQYYWHAYPNTTFKAGTYTVEDSDTSTWSANYDSGYAGITIIKGYASTSTQIVLEASAATVRPGDNFSVTSTLSGAAASGTKLYGALLFNGQLLFLPHLSPVPMPVAANTPAGAYSLLSMNPFPNLGIPSTLRVTFLSALLDEQGGIVGALQSVDVDIIPGETDVPVENDSTAGVLKDLLTSQTLSPSDTAQTVTADNGLSVTIPAGLLTAAAEVRIASRSGAATATSDQDEILASWDVSIGDLSTLSAPVTLEMPYDPSAIPSGVPASILLAAAHWSEEDSRWCLLPSVVDETRHVVIATTSHLSPKALVITRNARAITKSQLQASSTEFTFFGDFPFGYIGTFYTDFYLASDPRIMANTHFRLTWNKADEEGGQSYAESSADPEITAAMLRFSAVPDYVEDAWIYLHKAENAFSTRFTLPNPNPPVHVSDADSSSTSNLSIFNYAITLAYKTEYRQTRHDVAHEYFHAIQHQYYNAISFKLCKWWLEATADYAAEWVVWKGQNGVIGGEYISPKYLETPLTYASGLTTSGTAEWRDHEYTTAFFIEYLVRVTGVDFADLWKTTAESYNPDILALLDSYLRTKKSASLAETYTYFASWWVFSPDSPVRTRCGKTVAAVADASLARTLDSEDTSVTVTATLDGNHTAKVFCVTPVSSASYPIQAPGLPANCVVRAFTADYQASTYSMQANLGTAADKATVQASASSPIWILVINNTALTTSITVKIGTDSSTEPSGAPNIVFNTVTADGADVESCSNGSAVLVMTGADKSAYRFVLSWNPPSSAASWEFVLTGTQSTTYFGNSKPMYGSTKGAMKAYGYYTPSDYRIFGAESVVSISSGTTPNDFVFPTMSIRGAQGTADAAWAPPAEEDALVIMGTLDDLLLHDRSEAQIDFKIIYTLKP